MRPVKAEGPSNARIMIVGEAPGEVEIAQGRPFVGPSGDVLNQLLVDAGIDRNTCYVTNVMQIRPPANDFNKFFANVKKLEPGEELQIGVNRLRAEIDSVNPEVIICLGARPMWAILGLDGIEAYRGFPFRIPGKDINVIGTYHPAAVLRKWKNYPIAKMDICRAKEILDTHGRKPCITASSLNFRPSHQDVLSYLASCYSVSSSVDIEYSGEMIDCIGLSRGDGSAICIPFAMDDGDGSYWSEQQEVEIKNAVCQYLASSAPKILQNGNYDCFHLKQLWNCDVNNIVLDTMIAFNLLYPGMPKSLDFIASSYKASDGRYFPFWKQIPKVLGPDRWLYNAMDCLVTASCGIQILQQLEEQGLKDFYYKLPHKLLSPLLKMSLRGVLIDQEFRTRMQINYRKRINRLERALVATISPEEASLAQAEIKTLKKDLRGIFNPRSDAQLRGLLYKCWGFKPIRERGTASAKIDESAVRKLAELDKGKHKRFFAYLLQFNRLDKLYNTYLVAPLGRDGRMRCAYNIAGTVTGRLSSSAAPDETGTNLQNQPKSMRRMFLADPGHVMLQCDLEQAENRVVAYLANDPAMIKAFEDGVDIHSLIASMILRKPITSITKLERQLGKKVGHASNYGMGVMRMIQVCWEELGLKLNKAEAKKLQNQYFDAFPRIQHWQLGIQNALGRTRTLVTPLGRSRYFFERWGDELFKEAYAFQPQSTIVDILNLGLIALSEAGFDLLLQVHDSVNLNIADLINICTGTVSQVDLTVSEVPGSVSEPPRNCVTTPPEVCLRHSSTPPQTQFVAPSDTLQPLSDTVRLQARHSSIQTLQDQIATIRPLLEIPVTVGDKSVIIPIKFEVGPNWLDLSELR